MLLIVFDLSRDAIGWEEYGRWLVRVDWLEVKRSRSQLINWPNITPIQMLCVWEMCKNHSCEKSFAWFKYFSSQDKRRKDSGNGKGRYSITCKKGPLFYEGRLWQHNYRVINLWPSVRTSHPPFLRQCPFFTGTQSYNLTEQRKVETDLDWMTGIELTTLQLRRPLTNRLSYVCCDCYENTDLHQSNEASCCRKRGVQNCNICFTQKLKTGVFKLCFD